MKHARYTHGPSQKTISVEDNFLKEIFCLEKLHISNDRK